MNIKTNTKYINSTFFLLMFFVGIYASVFQSTVSNIAKSYKISDIYMGTFVTIYFIGGLLGSVLSGELGDRIGKKRVIIISDIVLVMGMLVMLYIQNVYAAYAGIFIAGLGINGANSLASSAIADINKGRVTKYMNRAHGLFCFGTVIGPLCVAALVKTGNWRLIYPPIAVLFLLLTVYMANFKFGDKIVKSKKQEKGIISFELLKKPSFFLLCFAMFLYVSAEAGTTYWMCSYFNAVFGNARTGIYLLSFFWGGMMIGRFVVSRFHQLEKKLLLGGVILSIVLTIVWQFSQNIILVTLCVTMTGASFAPVFCAILTKATSRFPDTTGSASGVAITLGSLGGVAVPFLMGIIAQIFSVRAAFFAIPVLLFALLGTLLYDEYSQRNCIKYAIAPND